MRCLIASLMIVLFLTASAFGQNLDGKRTVDSDGATLVEVDQGTEVSSTSVGIYCDLPRVAPVRKTVRFFKTKKPIRNAVVKVVKAKPVRTFLKRRKPARRAVFVAARVVAFPFRRCQ